VKLPGLNLLLDGYAVAAAIRAELPRESMDALVIGACWNDGVDAVRAKVAAAIGDRCSDAAWERGKVEAWSMYADESGGVWPRRTA
jgi:hypothetical protein